MLLVEKACTSGLDISQRRVVPRGNGDLEVTGSGVNAPSKHESGVRKRSEDRDYSLLTLDPRSLYFPRERELDSDVGMLALTTAMFERNNVGESGMHHLTEIQGTLSLLLHVRAFEGG